MAASAAATSSRRSSGHPRIHDTRPAIPALAARVSCRPCPATRTFPTRSTSTRSSCCGGRCPLRTCRRTQHLAYRAELKRQGKIVANGPFREQSDVGLRGLSIFTCGLAEAGRLNDGDPMVKAGWLGYDLFEWWIAAGTLAFPGVDGPVGDRRSMPDA